MKTTNFNRRIQSMGKTALAVAVAGLFAHWPAVATADTHNLTGPSSITKASDTNSVGVYYDDGNGLTGSVTPQINVGITINSGVDLLGETGIGSVPYAVYTFPSGNDNFFFTNGNQTSTLNLQGNNQITGLVGVHAVGANYSADPLSAINLNGTDITFNNLVFAKQIDFTQGGIVQFYGSVSGDSSAVSLDYNGHNATATLHNGVTLIGNVTNTAKNGGLIFTGNGTVTGNVASGSATNGAGTAIGLIEVRGAGALVKVDGSVSTDRLDFQAASTVAVGQTLYLNADTSANAVNGVRFNNHNGLLQVGGDLIGIAGKAAATTTLANTGTITMISGTQAIIGDLGASGLSLNTLNIGGTGSGVGIDASNNVASTTTVTGHVFAQTVSLNNAAGVSSALIMANDYNLTGNVVTDTPLSGRLTMSGGTQTVTGNVGATGRLALVESGANGATTTFTGTVAATTVSNTGTGTSTFQAAVSATTVDVAAGTSNFVQDLTATNINIGSGTGNFNTDGTSASSGNIVFTGGNGTANLHTGLTGNVNYGGQADATVNLWDGQTLTGSVSTTAANTGILNVLGAGTLSSDVGTGNPIKTLNVNTTAGASRTLVANGNVSAQSVVLQNDGVLQMADNRNLTGTITTTAADTGALTFSGSSTVTGNVGTDAMPLRAINAGITSETVTFNGGVAYATTLAYSGNGSVVFNGSSPTAATSDLGFVGTVDFGTNGSSSGTYTLGNDVDLITRNAAEAAAGTQTSFKDANGASLRFAGSSTVTGDLGAASNADNQNFRHIYADGNAGSTVTFNGKVFVASSTFYVNGTGTVNFNDDLYGPLVYSQAGVVNVADGKSIYPSVDPTGSGGVSTATNNTGILNFLGSTTTQVPVASAATARLAQVNFHSNTAVASATVNIGHDVYAQSTTIGNGTGTTTANITASGLYLGDQLTLSANTTLNTAGAINTAATVSPVDFAHVKITNGTLAPTATVTQSSMGSGVFSTDNASLNFLVGTQGWDSGAGGLVDPAASSKITGAAGSSLVMGANSSVNVGLLGSMRNGQTATLIDVSTPGATLPGTYRDNSYVIGTTLSRVNGALVMTASRDANTYVTQSQTAGHFSNPAAIRLGTLGAAGTGYTRDLQTVFNMLDIDQWGYGNTQANLATQVQRLAPIANHSIARSSIAMMGMTADGIGLRMHELRNTPQTRPYESVNVWIKSNYQSGKQLESGQYDGYRSELSGATFGVDSRPNNQSIAGAALSHGSGTVKQNQFREGEQAHLSAWQLSLYGAYDFTPELFVSGVFSVANQNAEGARRTALDRVALFDIDGSQTGYRLDLGYRIKLGKSAMMLTPMLSLEGRTLRQDAYTETNAGDVGLRVGEQTYKSQQAGLGLRLSSTEYLGGMVVKPELTLASMRESGTFPNSLQTSFIGDTTNQANFTTDLSAQTERVSKVSLGVGVLMSKRSSLLARYQYSKNGSFSSDTAELVARWDF